MLVYANEASPENNGGEGIFKANLSQGWIRIERKGFDAYLDRNFILMIADTNRVRIGMHVGQSSRRFNIMECSDHMMKYLPQYAAELAKQLTDRTGKYMKAWLYRHFLEVGGWKGLLKFGSGSDYPVSEALLEQRELSMNSVQLVVKEWLRRGHSVHPNRIKFRLPQCEFRSSGPVYTPDNRGLDYRARHDPNNFDPDCDSWVTAMTLGELYDQYKLDAPEHKGTEGEKPFGKTQFKAEIKGLLVFRTAEKVRVWVYKCIEEKKFPNMDNSAPFTRIIGAPNRRQMDIIVLAGLGVQKGNYQSKFKGTTFPTHYRHMYTKPDDHMDDTSQGGDDRGHIDQGVTTGSSTTRARGETAEAEAIGYDPYDVYPWDTDPKIQRIGRNVPNPEIPIPKVLPTTSGFSGNNAKLFPKPPIRDFECDSQDEWDPNPFDPSTLWTKGLTPDQLDDYEIGKATAHDFRRDDEEEDNMPPPPPPPCRPPPPQDKRRRTGYVSSGNFFGNIEPPGEDELDDVVRMDLSDSEENNTHARYMSPPPSDEDEDQGEEDEEEEEMGESTMSQ
jgi:hypothetical protein